MQPKHVEKTVGTKTIRLETGKLAKAADGAVVISCGDTTSLVTAVAAPHLREGIDFFPLTVDVEERHYAAGRIPGSFFRTEGRPTEKATLTCRLTDRPIRPSFADGFRHEVQIIATIMQVDGENPYDVHTITAASAALMLGGIPFAGPISGVRMAHIHGRWVPFPNFEEMANATIELIVAGRSSGGGVDVLMIEAGGFEHTWRLIQEGAAAPTEELLAEGLDACKPHITALCAMQQELVAQVEVPVRKFLEVVDYAPEVMERVKALTESDLKQALTITKKAERSDRLDTIKASLLEQLGGEFEGREKEIGNAFKSLQKQIMRRRILDDGIRIDGRGPADLRPLYTEVGLFKRLHGSGLFQRGETQAVSITTLDMLRMEMMLDTINPETAKRFMHVYRFPPFSVGETGRMGGLKRRDIGHGALAEKALLPVVPLDDEFPYAIRLVSEVLESNGSTSMASTCASCLSLMDAGVPIKAPVGGIAMGLVSEGDRHVTLTDILGAEDNYGDMDFKVAGTREFVTALQLDTKTTGINTDVLAQALRQAKDARLKILDAMANALAAPRTEMSEFAPRVEVVQIPVDKIGEVIGPKGKRINEITAETGVQIDIEDDGRVFVASRDGAGAERAIQMINDIANPRMLSVGEKFHGTVVKTAEFGAFVNVVPGKDGLVHISKLGRGKRLNKVEDAVQQGDKIWVEIQEIRPDGKLSLVPIDEPGAGNGGQTEEAESEPVG